MSTAEYRETAPPLLRLGTGADMDPGAHLLLTFDAAALPHIGLAHDDLLGEPFFVKQAPGCRPYTNIFDASTILGKSLAPISLEPIPI